MTPFPEYIRLCREDLILTQRPGLSPETSAAMERGHIEASDKPHWEKPWASNKEDVS